MIFLTFNDIYSGIYQGQVIDVCKCLEQELGLRIKLIAFISVRDFNRQRRRIKKAYPNALVFPMFPKVEFWKMNVVPLLFTNLLTNEKTVWARGPYACNLALSLRKLGVIKKVVFDARGAYEAELTEYDVSGSARLRKKISAIEETALRNSNTQLAVSGKLADWWKTRYGFTPKKRVVIPCTAASEYEQPFPSEDEISKYRQSFGYDEKDSVFVYSGSAAGWQSFDLVEKFLLEEFAKNPSAKLLFLTNRPPLESALFKKFSSRIHITWVTPAEVRTILFAADYGILIREKSVTNKVASPVKFAEYLATGLKVIISEEIGDCTEFVQAHACGYLPDYRKLDRPSYPEKIRLYQIAMEHFSKHAPSLIRQYSELLN